MEDSSEEIVIQMSQEVRKASAFLSMTAAAPNGLDFLRDKT
jgi:hypothetical protein